MTASEQDALSFASEVEEVRNFLTQGPLLDKLIVKVPTMDIPRLKMEYPTLFPQDIFQNPLSIQIFAITFIRGNNMGTGYAKLKIYVEMTGRRVLKIFATN